MANKQEESIQSREKKNRYMMKYHRTNFQDRCTHDMNGANQENQLIKYYKTGLGVRNTKCWWSIFFWIVGTVCVNSCLCIDSNQHHMDLIHYHIVSSGRQLLLNGWTGRYIGQQDMGLQKK